jgi:Arc/MetJ-type ribon-helix-helix transcriptional regulator
MSGVIMVTVSANVKESTMLNARITAQKEHRSLSNIIECSMEVFQHVPKEVRDLILELKGDDQRTALSDLGREMLRLTTRFRRERNMTLMVEQMKAPEGLKDADDDEVMDMADRLIAEAKSK